MANALRRPSVWLASAGVALLAAALLIAPARTWAQLFLLIAASLAVGLAPERVRFWLLALKRRSNATSPDAGQQLCQRPWLYVIHAIWMAAVFSLGEMAYGTYTKEITRWEIMGFHFMWLIPIGYAVIFATVGALMAFLGGKSSRVGLFVAALVMIGAFGWIRIVASELYRWAALLLALGVAVQVGRAAGRHVWLYRRVVEGTVAALVILTTGTAAMFYLWPAWQERRAIGALPPAADGRPNVLLIVLDTVRAASLSLYGHDRLTSPNLDRFASRGVVFDHAFSTAPWTLPSHGSMFTGRYPHELSTSFGTPLDATHPTIAEALSASGYLTAGFVANNWYASAAFGVGRGFVRYEDVPTSLASAVLTTSSGKELVKWSGAKERFATHDNFGRKSADDINRTFLNWLRLREGSRPFFAFLNYCDAHGPYVPPEPFATRFTPVRPRGDIGARAHDAWTPSEIAELNTAYDSAITYLDDRLGRLFEALAQRGVMQETIVIVTSDHGEQFGEHNLVEHVSSLYLPLLHVPLVVVAPDLPAGRRSKTFVSLRDIPATILDLAGVRAAVGFPGESLKRFIVDPLAAGAVVLSEVQRASSGYPDWYPARRGSMRSILFGGWHYIRNYGDQTEELYDVAADPDEEHDRASVEPVRLEEYRRLLERELQSSRSLEASRSEGRTGLE